jgi:acyl carrier protein
VQPELPIFVTAAGTAETYSRAGRAGAHLLTHLLGQSVEQLSEKIKLYRDAWNEAGHSGRGTVALMMHTFVGDDLAEVREVVYGPFREYLRSSVGLISGLAKGRGQDLRSADFTDEDMEALLDHAFDRYFETSALMGTRETCLATVERLKALDVDDVACLIDFGIPKDRVIASLDLLAEVHQLANSAAEEEVEEDYVSVPSQIRRHGVTHMQCTPSYAEMVRALPGGTDALSNLECLMVGGEAFPLPLARSLHETVNGTLLNMYGPTETTIWSSTERVDASDSAVSLGRPIANTELFVVDRRGGFVPAGVAGELWIGGRGVVRGYWNRPELTAERFVPHPLVPGERAYRTGDLVRYRSDGRLDFLGRLDHQVKVRGHRIELGEIESLLGQETRVRDTVVLAREDAPGDTRLVGYVVLHEAWPDAEGELRSALRKTLPEWMVPQHLVELDELPRTPNGKIDRARLPAPALQAPSAEFAPPASDVERVVAEVWADVLGRPSVGVNDNFFDLGGHSLLTVRVQAGLSERLGRVVPITDLFRFPTIRSLVTRLNESDADSGPAVVEAAAERAKARRGAVGRRRGRS